MIGDCLLEEDLNQPYPTCGSFPNDAIILNNTRADRNRIADELNKTYDRLHEESLLACDLRSSQDEIIERCAKAIEDFPDAARRLREHCAFTDDRAVSGEDFGQLRREKDKILDRVKELENQLAIILEESAGRLLDCVVMQNKVDELNYCLKLAIESKQYLKERLKFAESAMKDMDSAVYESVARSIMDEYFDKWDEHGNE